MAAGADHLVVAVVGFHNALYESVPNDVLLVKVHECDSFHAIQNVNGVQEPAFLSSGKIDLCLIAGNDHLGVESLAREDHLHLLERSVLGFVEDDKAVIQRAAAHKS